MAWEGREPLRDWIYLSVSLCFCVLSAALSPFRIYMEIRNSDWIETFAEIFFLKISFLAAKEEQQPPYGVPTRVRGAPEDCTRVRIGLSLAWKASLAVKYVDSFLCNRPYVTLDPPGVYINRRT